MSALGVQEEKDAATQGGGVLSRRDNDAALAGTAAGRAITQFDGIICFGGEDWWYHNRGHYDMQMMRELSAQMPVLYVNSIGMRMPRVGEGRMFLKRVLRKLKSFTRGLHVVRENFGVFSPATAPALHNKPIGQRLLAWQVRRAARRMGIRRPLVWVACPPAEGAVRYLPSAGLVYQRTDRFEEFPGVDPAHIGACDRRLKDAADLTLFCSSLLFEDEGRECRRTLFADHGVDYARFADAGKSNAELDDVKAIPHPRVGFVGGIDSHTFDPPLFLRVAELLPDCSFVMVGACSLEEGWCKLPNVHLLGKRPYEQVADYMAASDVLIMPWNQNEWIRACNPVKLKEYLAVGRPVVTRPFDELRRYAGMVSVAEDAEAFAAAIRAALNDRGDPAARRRRVIQETWTAKAQSVLDALKQLKIERT